MKKILLSLLIAAFSANATLLSAATDNRTMPDEVQRLHEQIRSEYAPDKRVATFDIDYTFSDQNVMLRGKTTSTEAKAKLVSGLKAMGYNVMDCIATLPDSESLGGKTLGIINLSTCALRSDADYAAEMVTQALLGMPVKLIERDGWYRIQTPDGYLSWTHRVGVHPVTQEEYDAWNRAEKVIVTTHHSFVLAKPEQGADVVSDIVGGNRLRFVEQKGKYFKVAYPDGREGYILRTEAMRESEWRKNLKQDAESIIATAKSLMGVPYLWGGTSSKGVDCSGLVRTTLFMHDIIIPRDASQQAYTGEHIDIAPDFSNLKAGDLLFFGSKATAERKERVVHVAIYMGDKRFIHSQGSVRINSFDPEDELFDSYNLGRLLFAARVLPYIGKQPSLNTTATNPFYK
ncbi:MAG: C40 family peptidase [Alistipes sp.]|nr:C40 family peptidase [Alistipes sp.]